MPALNEPSSSRHSESAIDTKDGNELPPNANTPQNRKPTRKCAIVSKQRTIKILNST